MTPEPHTSLAEIERYVDDYGIPWPNGYNANTTLEGFNLRGMVGIKFVLTPDRTVFWHSLKSGSLESAISRALETKVKNEQQ